MHQNNFHNFHFSWTSFGAQVCNGATLVHVDVLQNMKSENKNHMLLVEGK